MFAYTRMWFYGDPIAITTSRLPWGHRGTLRVVAWLASQPPPRIGTQPAPPMHATPHTSPHPQSHSIPKYNRSPVEPSGSVQLAVSAMLAHDAYDPVRYASLRRGSRWTN